MDSNQPTPTPQPIPDTQPTPTPVQPVQQASVQPPAQPSVQPVEQPLPQPVTDQQPTDPHFADQPAGAMPKASGDNPGLTFGVVSFVFALVGLGLFSLIFGIIGLKKSKRAGRGNGFAVAGIILGILEIIAAIIISIFVVTFAIGAFNTCNELGSGTHVLTNGASITCNI